LHASVDAMFSYDPGALVDYRGPLLVAVAESGTADDETARERVAALIDVLRARALAGDAPATVERFGGVGHNLMRYRADRLSAAILNLLEEAAHQRS